MKPSNVRKLKDVIDEKLIVRLSRKIATRYSRFDSRGFVRDASHAIKEKSFFERIQRAAVAMGAYLPQDFRKSTFLLLSIAPEPMRTEGYGTVNYEVLIMSKYVSFFGLAYPGTALPALGRLTQSYTAEFDIRPFIERYPERTFAFLHQLAKSRNFHKRRLASEGSRPRLPLARHLAFLKHDPRPSIRLLSVLRNDPIRYVQKSVANHLLDIQKDNPEIVHDVLSKWATENNQATNLIIRRVLQKAIHNGVRDGVSLAKQLALWRRQLSKAGSAR